MLRRHLYLPILWYRWLALVIGAAGYLLSGGEMSWLVMVPVAAVVLYTLALTVIGLLRRSLPWRWEIIVAADAVVSSLLLVVTGGSESPFLLYYLTPILEISLRASLSIAIGVSIGVGGLYPILVALAAGREWIDALLSPRFLIGEGIIFLLILLVILLIGPVLRWREQEGELARYEYLFQLSESQQVGVMAAITEEILRTLDVDVALIFLYDPTRDCLELQIPDPYPMATLSRVVLQRMKWDQEFLKGLMRGQSPAMLVGQDFREPVPDAMHSFFLRQPFFLAAPLLLGERPIGLLLAGRRRTPEAFQPGDLSSLAELTTRIARLIDWTESLANLRRRSHEISVLNLVMREINSPRRLEGVLQSIARGARMVLRVDRASVMLLDKDAQVLCVEAMDGFPFNRPISEGVPVGQGVSGWVAQHGEPIIVTQEDIGKFRSDGEREVRKSLCVPMRADERVIGVLNFSLISPGERELVQDDVRLAQLLADAAAVAIVKAGLMEEVLTQTEALSEANRQLSTERNKLEQMLCNVAEGVVVLDEQDRLILLNDAASDLLRVEEADLLGMDFNTYLQEQGLDELYALLQRLPEEAATLSDPLVYRGPVQGESGQTYELQINPFWSEGNEQRHYEGAVVVVRDITAEVEQEKVSSEFLSTFAEDVRAPLTSVKGYLELLQSRDPGPLTETQEQFISQASYKVDQCVNLINNFLDFSRIQDGEHLSLYFESLDVAEIIQEAADQVRRYAASRRQDLRVTLPPVLEPVIASRTGLRQVLSNLLENAIRNTSSQGQIFLRVEDEGVQLKFAVQDTGVGIPEEMRGRIFQQDDRVSGERGIGLGMYISKQIVEAHGGRIWFESEPGKGTVFFFTMLKDPTQSAVVED